jgi:hypothetical protein
MTIEDRIRRVLADAVAEEPPLRGTPLEAATRSRRGRPLLAGVIAMVLVLAAVVALAAVRGQRERGPVGPTPTTTTPADSGKAWKTFTDSTGHLRFRYPPDWALHRQPKRDDSVVLVPPEDAGRPIEQAGFQLRVDLDDVFWVGEMWFGTTTRGRLPNGQAYLLEINAPPAALNNQGWGMYSIDWGRYCAGHGRSYCGPHSVLVSYRASSSPAWDRYRTVADTIVRTVTMLRPTEPAVGDRSRRSCRPDQWRLVWPEEYAFGNDQQRMVLQGGGAVP